MNAIWSEKDCKLALEKVVDSFRKSVAGVRTGRASPGLVESVFVEAYETKMKLSQLASVDILDDRTLIVRPFDRAITAQIDKSLIAANIGLNPSVESGNVIVKIPKMTEDIRKEIVKNVKKMCEDAKVYSRNVRRDFMDIIKEEKKEGTMSEDKAKRASDVVQKLTDEVTSSIDKICDQKIDEIMSV